MADQDTQGVIDAINAAVKGQEQGFGIEPNEVQGPANANVLQQDRKYKSAKLADGQELFFKGVRGGSRAKLIFEFTPVDDQPWVQVEFEDARVFDVVKGFEHKLGLALVGPHPADEEWRWTDAMNRFKRDAKKLRAEAEKRREEERRLAAARADAVYEDNPEFGTF